MRNASTGKASRGSRTGWSRSSSAQPASCMLAQTANEPPSTTAKSRATAQPPPVRRVQLSKHDSRVHVSAWLGGALPLSAASRSSSMLMSPPREVGSRWPQERSAPEEVRLDGPFGAVRAWPGCPRPQGRRCSAGRLPGPGDGAVCAPAARTPRAPRRGAACALAGGPACRAHGSPRRDSETARRPGWRRRGGHQAAGRITTTSQRRYAASMASWAMSSPRRPGQRTRQCDQARATRVEVEHVEALGDPELDDLVMAVARLDHVVDPTAGGVRPLDRARSRSPREDARFTRIRLSCRSRGEIRRRRHVPGRRDLPTPPGGQGSQVEEGVSAAEVFTTAAIRGVRVEHVLSIAQEAADAGLFVRAFARPPQSVCLVLRGS